MNQPTLFLYTIRMGQKEGYPPCCIFQFAQEVIVGKKPFMLRKCLIRGCVPCDKCYELYKKRLSQGHGLHRDKSGDYFIE